MKGNILLTLLLLICGCTNNDAVNRLSAKGRTITEKQARRIFSESKGFPNGTQLAVAIIENGDPKFYGIKRENDSIFIIENSRSVFEIGSITKVFTATLLADLVLEKKVQLEDTINDYLGFPLKDSARITFKDLANHTSGLPRMPSNSEFTYANFAKSIAEYDEVKLKAYFENKPVVTKPFEKRYEYSNLGAALLGYLLEKIDSGDYGSLVQRRIFSKYHMTSSSAAGNEVRDKLVKGLDLNGREIPNRNRTVFRAAGGIFSTAEDLSKFAVAQFDCSNDELAMTRTKTFRVNGKLQVGLGWHIVKSRSGAEWHFHNGGTSGYSSAMAIDVKTRDGVVILSNVSTFHPQMVNITNLCFSLIETIQKE